MLIHKILLGSTDRIPRKTSVSEKDGKAEKMELHKHHPTELPEKKPHCKCITM